MTNTYKLYKMTQSKYSLKSVTFENGESNQIQKNTSLVDEDLN